jgi:hypothetical protein
MTIYAFEHGVHMTREQYAQHIADRRRAQSLAEMEAQLAQRQRDVADRIDAIVTRLQPTPLSRLLAEADPADREHVEYYLRRVQRCRAS